MGKASYRQHSVTEHQHNLGKSVLRENKQTLRAVEHGSVSGGIHYGKQHAETAAIYSEHQAEHQAAHEQPPSRDEPRNEERSPVSEKNQVWAERWDAWKTLGREVNDGWRQVRASARMFRRGTAQIVATPRKGVKLLAQQLFG